MQHRVTKTSFESARAQYARINGACARTGAEVDLGDEPGVVLRGENRSEPRRHVRQVKLVCRKNSGPLNKKSKLVGVQLYLKHFSRNVHMIKSPST